MAIWCCCGGVENPCENDDPPLEVTITWAGTPTGVNYQAGPPETIDLFGYTWEKNDTNLVCPTSYGYAPNASTAATPSSFAAYWAYSNSVSPAGVINFSNRFITTLSANYLSQELIRTVGTTARFFWNAFFFTGGPSSGTSTAHTMTSAQRSGDERDWVNGAAMQQPLDFDQFGGMCTTANGITITWAKSEFFP